MNLETKRLLIREAIHQHRKYGTKFAVEKLLNTLSSGANVTEWWNYTDTPYHFKIKVKELKDLEDDGERIMRAIDVAKSLRDWLDAFDFDLSKEHPDEILHVGFADIEQGKIFHDLDTNFEEAHKLRRVAFDVTSGKISYNDDLNFKPVHNLRAGFIHFQHGKITYTCNYEPDDETWYKLWLNYIKMKWKNWHDAKIIYWNDEEPIDDDEPDEESFSGNFLKLYLNFHNSDLSRLIVLPFPRDNLSGKDINAVNVDGIFVKRGYLSNKIYRAVYAQKDITKIYF